MGGHVSQIGGKKNANRIMVEESEGNRLLGRPRHTWDDNIKLIVESMRGIHVVLSIEMHCRLLNT
jgi:hypothetical protein